MRLVHQTRDDAAVVRDVGGPPSVFILWHRPRNETKSYQGNLALHIFGYVPYPLANGNNIISHCVRLFLFSSAHDWFDEPVLAR